MRVIVADDHSLFRDGIVSLLEAAGHQVVEQVGDGKSAVESAEHQQPDLVLMDINMPGMSGLEALVLIKKAAPEARVVMLTVSDDDADLFTAIKAGADGYLLKDLNASTFLEMLEGLERGDAAVTRKTAKRLMGGFKELSRQPESASGELTAREFELLSLLGKGLSNKVIAQRMFISENTVKYHIRNILQKLGVQNRTEAVATALRNGLIRPDNPE
jgi:DNA-binding NarL/FixJ family response regulator